MFFFRTYHLIEFPAEFDPEEVESYNARLQHLAKHSKKSLLIDFKNVEMIHSSGLGLLVNNYKFCRSHGAYFGLVNVNPAVLALIKAARLDNLIKVYPSMKDIKPKKLAHPTQRQGDIPEEFEYHEIFLNGVKMLICEGIMGDSRTFKNFIQDVLKSDQVILDFTNLSFIELNCLAFFNDFCQKSKVFIYGVNESLEDEFRFFEIKHKFTQAESLKEIIRQL